MRYIITYRETMVSSGPFETMREAIGHAIACDLAMGEDPDAWLGWDEDVNDGREVGILLDSLNESGWTVGELLSPADMLEGARETAQHERIPVALDEEDPAAWLDSAIEDANESAFDGGEL